MVKKNYMAMPIFVNSMWRIDTQL